MTETPDWNGRYAEGDTPWDTGQPSKELQRVLAEWKIQPCRALDAGCGTGTNALYLAQCGFEVTAFDLSELAIVQAHSRTRDAIGDVTFLTADLVEMPGVGAPFPFVFDRGFYHVVRKENLDSFLRFISEVTEPGSLWLTLAGNANDQQPREKGPPQVRAAEICEELEPLFAVVQMREFHFETKTDDESTRPLAWSVLLRRR